MREEAFLHSRKALPADVAAFVCRSDERVVMVHLAVAFLAPHRGPISNLGIHGFWHLNCSSLDLVHQHKFSFSPLILPDRARIPFARGARRQRRKSLTNLSSWNRFGETLLRLSRVLVRYGDLEATKSFQYHSYRCLQCENFYFLA